MKNKKTDVDALLAQEQWHDERKLLREILLACKLDEELKWGKLCYTWENSNVAMIYGMKNYCAIGFFKGALLKDPKGILVRPGDHSQAMRQIRFTGIDELKAKEKEVKAFIRDAIGVEKAGLQIDFKERRELGYPAELQKAFDTDGAFKTAFEALTPGRQRAYILHIAGAKQSATRLSRIEKCAPRIFDGKGMHDR